MTAKDNKLVEELFRKHYQEIVIYAFHLLYDWPTANEVAQDAFHLAVERIDVFRASPNQVGWLKKTVRFIVANLERRKALERKIFVAIEDVAEISYSDSRELPLTLGTLYGKILSEEDLFLVQRIILEKETFIEVAKELHITVWACQKRMQRLLKRLKEEIDST